MNRIDSNVVPSVRPLADSLAREQPYDTAAGSDAAGLDLLFYWRLIRPYAWYLVGFVAVVTLGTFLVTLNMAKRYESVAIVRIDPTGIQVTDASGLQQPTNQDRAGMVATEAAVATSPAVIEQTIQSLHLERQPEFAVAGSNAPSPRAKAEAILRAVTRAVSVVQPLQTWLLEIHARAKSPELAAELANGVAQNFLDLEYSTRANSLNLSATYMEHQLDGLRTEMEDSQAALVNYGRQYGIENPDNSDNVLQARLDQLNQEAGKVQEQRIKLQAETQDVASGHLDALLVTGRGDTLLPLYRQLQADQRKYGEEALIYGPNHPVLQQQGQLVDRDRAALEKAERDLSAQIDHEYAMVVDRETLLNRALANQRRAINNFDLKAIRYRALKGQADSYTKLYYDLEQRVQQANVSAGFRSEDLRVISPARPVDTPVSPRVGLSLGVAFAFSLLLGLGSALAVGMGDQTVASPERVEHWFQLPTLATLPPVAVRGTPGALRPLEQALHQALPENGSGGGGQRRSAYWEQVVALHSALMFLEIDRPMVLALTSAQPGEGKSTVLAHLACCFALLGSRTLLIDADVRKPSVHRLFNLTNRIGLSSALSATSTPEAGIQDCPIPGLSLMPAGPPSAQSPTELFHRGMDDLLTRLRSRYDVILIDCPPTMGFADAPTIGNLCDGVLLLVHAGKTDRSLVRAALRQLRSARVHLLGVVLNRVDQRAGAYYSSNYYSSYYDKAENDEDED